MRARQPALSFFGLVTATLAVTSAPFVLPAWAANDHQKISGRTSQPIGHYEYCKKNSADCRIVSNGQSVKLTRSRWAEIVEANAIVNHTIKPVTDKEYYGVEEYWVLPESAGDCEDFVLLKRKFLMQKGWPASALLPTVVLQPNGDGHAVLTVRTDRADYILDNLDGKIYQWNDTGYKYLKRVSARHSGQWEDIVDSRKAVAHLKRQTD